MKRLLLVGAGHAHAQVLLDWARRPASGVELVLISPQALAPYSGMVPGWLAGHYRFEDIAVDFAALSHRAGARWLQDELHALNPDQQQLELASGQRLSYDLLSLNVGSTLRPPTDSAAQMLSLRPLARLRVAYETWLKHWAQDGQASSRARAPFRVTAVGGGAAGFESLLAVLARLRTLQPGRELSGRLITQSSELLPGLSNTARRAAERALQQAAISVERQTAWTQDHVANCDLALWATGAQAHDWQLDAQRRGSLAVSAQGFVRIGAELRSVSHPSVFAVGDCAHWDSGAALPKAGVYAVRMGPVLTHNLRAAIAGQTLETYRPQRQFLVLLATGDGRAIASRGRWGAAGRWAWHWKHHIDTRFIARYAE